NEDQLSLEFGLLPAYLSAALYLSPMTFASGLLAGRGGLPFFFGGGCRLVVDLPPDGQSRLADPRPGWP
ncbi:MAG: hypothetical protein H7836_09555, partial [Magnetococcus sp. YQC-3]